MRFAGIAHDRRKSGLWGGRIEQPGRTSRAWSGRSPAAVKATTRHGFSVAVAGLLAAAALVCQAQPQQAYPAHPIRLIIQYPAGGALDGLARSVAERASTLLGQPILVDNRPGASGFIAFEACAKAAPDGYTICQGTGEAMSFNPALFPKMPYDPARDFVPVVQLVQIQGVIIGSGQAPFTSLPELITAARARPGTLNWASFGAASNPHIFLEWIKRQAGVDIAHIPYKGSAQTTPAVISNEAQATYTALGFVLPQIRAGRLRALAATTPRRLTQLPDVPTLAELGLDPGFQSWVGLFAPAGTPRTAIDRLHNAFAATVKDPAFRDRYLAVQAFDPVGDSPEAFAAMVAADREVARKVVQATGIRADLQ